MNKARYFIRENRDIVLLVCDFYETKQIPREMTDIKKNLTLFPVANIPLIEYIIASLYEQSLKTIILTGKHCEEIIAYLKGTEFWDNMDIISLNCNGKNLGDLMRYIDDCAFEFKNLVVIYANHFTTYPIKNVLERHKSSKDNVALTLFLHPNESNSKIHHLYGIKNGEIVYYDKCVNEKYNYNGIIKATEEHKTIEFNAGFSSPTIAIVSPTVFHLFTENFDYTNFGDLITGILTLNVYNLKILACLQYSDDIVDAFGCLNLSSKYLPYSKEVITLYDYFKLNEDVKSGIAVDIFKFKCKSDEGYKSFVQVEGNITVEIQDSDYYEPIHNTVLGESLIFKKNCQITNSFVGHGCYINANVERCIIWDDVNVVQDFIDHILFSDGRVIHYNHLETEMDINEINEGKKETSFFDDILEYLWSLVEVSNLDDLDIEDVVKQVTLLRIIWNASNLDLIEAFSIFMIEMVDFNDIEGSTITASLFFPILYGHTTEEEEQLCLMENVWKGFENAQLSIRKDVIYRYGYLLLEDSIISRSIFKKYNKMLKTLPAW